MHQRNKQFTTKKIKTSRSKSRGYLDSYIVNQTIIMTDKVLSWPTWLEVQTDCIEVCYVEVCRRVCAKVVGHRVIQNPQLTQQLHVGVEVIDDCQSLKCMPTWRKHTKFHRVAHKFFSAVIDDSQTGRSLKLEALSSSVRSMWSQGPCDLQADAPSIVYIYHYIR